MLRSCIVCRAVATPDLQLQYCAQCQSALYCSKACQRKDWKKQHKKICKLLNVGHGDMQVRDTIHTSASFNTQERFGRNDRSLDGDRKLFFKLFEESNFEGSRAAAQKMSKIAKRFTKNNQKFLLFHSLNSLIRSSNLEMLSWPNSPLLVMLQFVDPIVLLGDEETKETPLHYLATQLHHSNYSTHENQLILAKQLIEHGANVNAVSTPHNMTPLHLACYAGFVTSLDFVELLLVEGADPNAQDVFGTSPLMNTVELAPGAAKFLLNWPTTDVNITNRSGESFWVSVRIAVEDFSHRITFPNNPEQVQHQFLLQQWTEIEEMLVERGARE
jgi:hypothetical protein